MLSRSIQSRSRCPRRLRIRQVDNVEFPSLLVPLIDPPVRCPSAGLASLYFGARSRCRMRSIFRFFWFHKPPAPPSAAHERFAAQLPFVQARCPQLHSIPHGALRVWHGLPRDDMRA
jgi:hypothetical protein